jgi:hypothetical protein
MDIAITETLFGLGRQFLTPIVLIATLALWGLVACGAVGRAIQLVQDRTYMRRNAASLPAVARRPFGLTRDLRLQTSDSRLHGSS